MKLEKQVCSLELAKKLKELGVKQKSRFYWVHEHIEYEEGSEFLRELKEYDRVTFSAFTVAEIGEMLKENYVNWADYCNGKWHWVDTKGNEILADTEADIRAKMLINLIENNVVKI